MARFYPRADEGVAPPEFGRPENVILVKRFYLDNARDLEQVEIGGTMLWAYAATSLTANIAIRLNDQLRGPITFQRGMYLRGSQFSRVFVSHAAQAGEWLDLVYAVEGKDFIQIENPAIAFTEVTFTKATVLETLADQALVAAAAAAVILAANAARREAIIKSLSTNTQVIRIGDLNTGAARGQEVMPGDTLILSTTEAIYGYTGAGVNQTVTKTWTED
jgi:hypothetical protein